MDPAYLLNITEQKLLCLFVSALFYQRIEMFFQRLSLEEFQTDTLFFQYTLVQFQTFFGIDPCHLSGKGFQIPYMFLCCSFCRNFSNKTIFFAFFADIGTKGEFR